jgi:hypothetical protein
MGPPRAEGRAPRAADQAWQQSSSLRGADGISHSAFTNRADDRLQRRGIQNVIRLVRFRFKPVNPADCIVKASNEACQPLRATYAPHQKDHRRVVAGFHYSLTKGLDRQGTLSDTGFRYRRCKYEVFLGVGYQTHQALLPRIHTRKHVCRKQAFEGCCTSETVDRRDERMSVRIRYPRRTRQRVRHNVFRSRRSRGQRPGGPAQKTDIPMVMVRRVIDTVNSSS